MSRFHAFAIHLGISLAIFAVLGYIVVFHWYPDFFFTTDGGWQGIRIIAAVDLVLGPTLTLIVFKAGKPSLKFDLTVIAAIQFACLAAGVWVVHSERPVAMLYADGSFFSMTRDDYLDYGQPLPDFNSYPGWGPAWVTLALPEDPTSQSAIRRAAIKANKPLRTYSDYYVPFDPAHVDVLKAGYDPAGLTRRDKVTPFFESFLDRHGGRVEDYTYLPFGTRYSIAILAMRLADGELALLEIPKTAEEEKQADEVADAS